LGNIPPIANSNAILNQLQQMRQGMQQMRRDFHKEMEQVRKEMEQMRRISKRNWNKRREMRQVWQRQQLQQEGMIRRVRVDLTEMRGEIFGACKGGGQSDLKSLVCGLFGIWFAD
jgi:RNA polymerase-binding transcription factor DksA